MRLVGAMRSVSSHRECRVYALKCPRALGWEPRERFVRREFDVGLGDDHADAMEGQPYAELRKIDFTNANHASPRSVFCHCATFSNKFQRVQGPQFATECQV